MKLYKNNFLLHILPALGALPVVQVTKKMLADLCLSVSQRAPAQAVKVATILKLFFRYCEERGLIENSCAESVARILPKVDGGHFAAITDEKGVRGMLTTLDCYFEQSQAGPQVKMAVKLLIFTGMRIGAVCGLQWADIDLEQGKIEVRPRDGNKTRSGFSVYLGPLTLQKLQEYAEVRVDETYVFPSVQTQKGKLAETTIRSFFMYAGIGAEHPAHAWRQVLKTIASEHGVPSLISELALGHKVGNTLEQTYNRAGYERVLRSFAEWYENALSAIKAGDPVQDWTGSQFV